VQNQLGTADVEALNNPSAREYVPWRILDERGSKVLVQWRGYGRDDATWEKSDDLPDNFLKSYKQSDGEAQEHVRHAAWGRTTGFLGRFLQDVTYILAGEGRLVADCPAAAIGWPARDRSFRVLDR
jgi:hypothetical protein